MRYIIFQSSDIQFVERKREGKARKRPVRVRNTRTRNSKARWNIEVLSRKVRTFGRPFGGNHLALARSIASRSESKRVPQAISFSLSLSPSLSFFLSIYLSVRSGKSERKKKMRGKRTWSGREEGGGGGGRKAAGETRWQHAYLARASTTCLSRVNSIAVIRNALLV